MDFASLAAYGRSPTWTAWATNPVRQILWRLIGPYFRAAGREIDWHVATEIDNRMRNFAAEIDKSSRATLSLVQQDIAASSHKSEQDIVALREGMQEAVRTAAASQLSGMRKEALAVTHRLAGLEEEAFKAEQAREALEERLAGLRAHVHDTVAFISSLQEEIRSIAQTSSEQANGLAQGQQELRAVVHASQERIDAWTPVQEALQREHRSAVQSLNERIDALARGVPLRAGERLSVGEGNLVIAASPVGARFLVHQQDLIGHLIVDGREWEPHVRSVIEHAARPEAIAVDAGAYIGVHTVTMSRWFRTVHAFEPQRGIFQMLCGNLALNGRLNVITYNAALYDRAGSMRLAPQEHQEVDVPTCNGQPNYDQIKNAAALSFDFIADGSGDVRAIALDDIGLDNVALIKVDTQGADLCVLRGSRETIRRCRPVVLFEWERDLGLQHGTGLDDYHAFFSELGYDVTILQDTTPGRQADYLAKPRQ